MLSDSRRVRVAGSNEVAMWCFRWCANDGARTMERTLNYSNDNRTGLGREALLSEPSHRTLGFLFSPWVAAMSHARISVSSCACEGLRVTGTNMVIHA